MEEGARFSREGARREVLDEADCRDGNEFLKAKTRRGKKEDVQQDDKFIRS